jgi:anion-transporting  ArsA/GET3 family ATPase
VLAAALASICARTQQTMLVTFDARDAVNPFLGVKLRYEPTKVSQRLMACRLEANAAIREYVSRRLPFSLMYDSFLKSRMFRDFSDAAPGFQELMSLGKLYDLSTDSGIDRIVLDAPATGHLKTLLDVPAATLAAVHVGPLNHNARKIQDLLLDPERTRVVLVTLAEEMAVREALELRDFCAQRRMNVGPVLLNQNVAARFRPEEVAALSTIADVGALGVAAHAAVAEAELAAVMFDAAASLETLDVIPVPRFPTHEPTDLVDQIVRSLTAVAVPGG